MNPENPLDDKIDSKKYETLLIKALKNLLNPFNINEQKIREKLGKTQQTRLVI
jgi:hypothetical protein